jgi:hypothetical protein
MQIPSSSTTPNGSFTVIIASTGVAQRLVPITYGQQAAARADIQALSANTSYVIVGGSAVTSDHLNGGIKLYPGTSASNISGDIYNIEIMRDLTPIYIVGTAGDGVAVTWWQGDRV